MWLSGIAECYHLVVPLCSRVNLFTKDVEFWNFFVESPSFLGAVQKKHFVMLQKYDIWFVLSVKR